MKENDTKSTTETKSLFESGMATALSIDYWSTPPSSDNKLTCKSNPNLSVNFICMHPPPPPLPSSSSSSSQQGEKEQQVPKSSKPNKPRAARFQEIFLDYLNMKCSNINTYNSSKHLLDDRFDSFLPKNEREFKDALLKFIQHDLSHEAKASQGYHVLMDTLSRKMGHCYGNDDYKRRRGRRGGKSKGGSFSKYFKGGERDNLDHEGRMKRLDKQRRLVMLSKNDGETSMDNNEEMDISSDDDSSKEKIDQVSEQYKKLKNALELIREKCNPKLLSQLCFSDIDVSTSSGQELLKSNLLQIVLHHYRRLQQQHQHQQPSPQSFPGPSKQELQYIEEILSNPFIFSSANDKETIKQQEQIIQKSGLLQPPGHVFVSNTSICDLYCDAILIPGAIGKPGTDSINGSIWSQWCKNTFDTIMPSQLMDEHYNVKNKPLKERIFPFQLKRYEKYDRVVTHEHWPWKEFFQKGGGDEEEMVPIPFPVMGQVSFESVVHHQTNSETNNLSESAKPAIRTKGKDKPRYKLPTEEEHINALMSTVHQFIQVSLSELRVNQKQPLAKRIKYLLALPVIGTGGAHAGDLTGQIIESLLHVMSDYVLVEKDVDMVLVCADEATHAHAQSIRNQLIVNYGFDDECHSDDELSWHAHHHFPPVDMVGGTIYKETNYDRETVGRKDESKHRKDLLPLFACFEWMTNEMRDKADQLAEMASSGHLALFLGAGISIGSGLPGWFDLLHIVEDLFTPTGNPKERKLGDATKWNPLHMANLLDGICISRSDRNGHRKELKKRICDYISIRAQYPCLLLSLLSSLPCQQKVTQNYDCLIEKSFECRNISSRQRQQLSVIPYQPRRNSHHWLLKMHGCVTVPDDIIITGDDYAAYETLSRYKALGGLVQASLITKHLLFVGFSLSDPNYLRIIEQVRDALRHADEDGNEDAEGDKEEDMEEGYNRKLKRCDMRDRTV